MKKVLVTGNIGSGKSLFCQKLRDLGYPTLDADVLAREVLYDPNVEAEVKELLGEDSFLAKGQLNRPLIAQRVFAEPRLRKSLESILHPKINSEFQKRCRALHKLFPNSWLFYEASLVIEIGEQRQFDASVFITVDREKRFKRLKQSRNMEKEAVEKVLEAQMSDIEKASQCHIVFDNSGSGPLLEEFVYSLPRKLLPILTP